MATFYKRNNKWHALIRRRGLPTMDKSFDTKKHAMVWARQIESKFDNGIVEDMRAATKVTMSELFTRYGEATAGIKKNAVHERYALKILASEFGHLSLAMLTRVKISAVRDKRLALGLSPSTVRNNLHLLSAVVRTAINDWAKRWSPFVGHCFRDWRNSSTLEPQQLLLTGPTGSSLLVH